MLLVVGEEEMSLNHLPWLVVMVDMVVVELVVEVLVLPILDHQLLV